MGIGPEQPDTTRVMGKPIAHWFFLEIGKCLSLGQMRCDKKCAEKLLHFPESLYGSDPHFLWTLPRMDITKITWGEADLQRKAELRECKETAGNSTELCLIRSDSGLAQFCKQVNSPFELDFPLRKHLNWHSYQFSLNWVSFKEQVLGIERNEAFERAGSTMKKKVVGNVLGRISVTGKWERQSHLNRQSGFRATLFKVVW